MPEYPDGDVTVSDRPAANRFEIRIGDGVAGFVSYRPAESKYTFTHTEVDDRFEGQGLGSRLVAGALDAMRERHTSVLPVCPFVRDYIDRHPEYLDLVAADDRARFQLPGPD